MKSQGTQLKNIMVHRRSVELSSLLQQRLSRGQVVPPWHQMEGRVGEERKVREIGKNGKYLNVIDLTAPATPKCGSRLGMADLKEDKSAASQRVSKRDVTRVAVLSSCRSLDKLEL